MLRFQSFAYLDLQKTASTFLTQVFRFIAREKVVAYRQHQPLEALPQRGFQIFQSVREPGAWYQSLLDYGRSKRGALFRKLEELELESIYKPTTTNSEFQEFLARESIQVRLGKAILPFGPDPTQLLYSQRFFFIRGFKSLEDGLAGIGLHSHDDGLYGPVSFIRQEALEEDLRQLCIRFPQILSLDRLSDAVKIGTVNASLREQSRTSHAAGEGPVSYDLPLRRFLTELYRSLDGG